MPFQEQMSGLWRGTLNPQKGELARLWREFRAEVIIGHPTFRNQDNIGRQLAEGIRGATSNFGERQVAFVVSDGSWTEASGDQSTVDAALAAAREALSALDEQARGRIQVVVTPYEGYDGDQTPGKGSALKMIFEEMAEAPASLLILLDGDLRNDMGQWHGVFAEVEREHRQKHPGRPFFVTARYARHFVDASLTRFVVGPLTTLMGKYVPGGISGDIVLSAEAVAHERASAWSEARRKYGTDIATTFDNIADPETLIYEVYLGAKLHDITDDAKLSVMPGEVIGAALERLLHWESIDGRVSKRIASKAPLDEVVAWGPARTGIQFVDPGYTDVFNVDAKMATLLDRFDEFAEAIAEVQGAEVLAELQARRQALAALKAKGSGSLAFLGVTGEQWIALMQRAVAYLLVEQSTEAAKRSLNYLYTAAFLEFVKDRLADLGYRTLAEVRQAQAMLGVPADKAPTFYTDRVDDFARDLAHRFYQERRRILDFVRRH